MAKSDIALVELRGWSLSVFKGDNKGDSRISYYGLMMQYNTRHTYHGWYKRNLRRSWSRMTNGVVRDRQNVFQVIF